MVLTALRHLSEHIDKGNPLFEEPEKAWVCDQRDFHIAMTICTCLLKHTIQVYKQLNHSSKAYGSSQGKSIPNTIRRFWEALPDGDPFSTG